MLGKNSIAPVQLVDQIVLRLAESYQYPRKYAWWGVDRKYEYGR